jgi:amino-acid N-acetyltransferase
MPVKKEKPPLPGQVRHARMDDIEQIYRAIRENPKQVLPRSYPDLLQNFDRFMVYEEKGKVKGVISWQVLPNVEINADRTIEVVSFSVRRRSQGRGIGALLLNKMLEEIESYGPDKILVLTFYPKFFRKFGFRKVSKRKLFSKIYIGCIKCTKYPSPLTCPETAMVRQLTPKEK